MRQPIQTSRLSDCFHGLKIRICAAALALCSLICSCTTTYGEIVFKIQYTPANGGTASEDELKSVFSDYFTQTTSLGIFEAPDYSEWDKGTTFAPDQFRLDNSLENEGQYMLKESFEGRHLHQDPKVEMSFCCFPQENTIFLRYSWNSNHGVSRDGFSDEAILDLNEQVKNVMRSKGYAVDRLVLYNREEAEGDDPDYKVAEFFVKTSAGKAPSELELKKALENEFFFPIAIMVRNREMGIDDFCMYDIFRRCVILYNRQTGVIRLVDMFRGNTNNFELLVSALKRNHFSVTESPDRTVSESGTVRKTLSEKGFRFLYFNALGPDGDYWEDGILNYVVSFDE